MSNPNAIATHRHDGHYSTARIGDYIETMWFPNEGEGWLIDRTYVTLERVAQEHIENYETRRG